MYFTVALVLGIVSVAILAGLLFLLKRRVSGSLGREMELISQEAGTIGTEIDRLLDRSSNFAPKGQLDWLKEQLDSIGMEVENQRRILKEFETKLEGAQGQIEAKETSQQELKTSRREDEERLNQLLASFKDISQESIALEQRLAASLKNLDGLMVGMTLTPDQRATLMELQNVMVSSGGRLRELITEYEAVKNRLEVLRQQHKDLEEEYTRLVEQQLGE